MLGSVPFTFVIVGVAWSWLKALRAETAAAPVPAAVPATPVGARTTPPLAGGEE